jgi:glycosyltransferase involved in cell wall biosynthesis
VPADRAALPAPRVSVIVETITAREHPGGAPLADEIAPTLAAIDGQGWPCAALEILVVLDPDTRDQAAAIAARWPAVRVVVAPAVNYFAAKNAGVAAASASIVALLDADCRPEPGWLDALTGALAPGVDVVAGRTRYEGGSLPARTFSVPDFANVVETTDGASGINLNNVAYRRDVFLGEPLDARVRRNGGCYFQYHALRARGARIAYAPAAVVSHGLDVHGLGFVRKHFERGFDGALVYRLDDRGVLRGSRVVRRFGPAGLAALHGRRVVWDWLRLARYRRQIGVRATALPYYGAVALLTRGIELAGGLAAWVRPGLLPASPPADAGARR